MSKKIVPHTHGFSSTHLDVLIEGPFDFTLSEFKSLLDAVYEDVETEIESVQKQYVVTGPVTVTGSGMLDTDLILTFSREETDEEYDKRLGQERRARNGVMEKIKSLASQAGLEVEIKIKD